MSDILLEAKNLTKHFQSSGFPARKRNVVHAVDGVSFSIKKGETFGLVGESGCGKSTVGRLLLRLIEPTAGQVFFNGLNIYELGKKDMRLLRREMQIIFQDPFSSLNPRMNVNDIIGEPLDIHGLATKGNKKAKIFELLEMVGLSPEHAKRYPHEFSGGQRQRIGIARALALRPQFIVADEPVSSLDVSIRAQILNLMKDLQKSLGLTYLFIAHDLSIVKYLSDKVAVMYLGKIMEMGIANSIFQRPCHPYTKSLLDAVAIPDPDVQRKRLILDEDEPNLANPSLGCPFHPRCPQAMERCRLSEPALVELDNEHQVACHLTE